MHMQRLDYNSPVISHPVHPPQLKNLKKAAHSLASPVDSLAKAAAEKARAIEEKQRALEVATREAAANRDALAVARDIAERLKREGGAGGAGGVYAVAVDARGHAESQGEWVWL